MLPSSCFGSYQQLPIPIIHYCWPWADVNQIWESCFCTCNGQDIRLFGILEPWSFVGNFPPAFVNICYNVIQGKLELQKACYTAFQILIFSCWNSRALGVTDRRGNWCHSQDNNTISSRIHLSPWRWGGRPPVCALILITSLPPLPAPLRLLATGCSQDSTAKTQKAVFQEWT